MARKNNSKPAAKESPFASTTPRPFAAPTVRPPETPRPEMQRPSAATATAVATAPRPKPAPTRDEISARAKAIWEASGHRPGRDDQNWLEAERQLKRERGLC